MFLLAGILYLASQAGLVVHAIDETDWCASCGHTETRWDAECGGDCEQPTHHHHGHDHDSRHCHTCSCDTSQIDPEPAAAESDLGPGPAAEHNAELAPGHNHLSSTACRAPPGLLL